MVEDLLWSHQIQAIKMLIQYIDDYHNGDTNQAALVQMPTGSGKSGVIAYLSRCLPDIGLTIVLTPRISLRDQLSSDISGRFFKHIGYPVEIPLQKAPFECPYCRSTSGHGGENQSKIESEQGLKPTYWVHQ